MFGKRKRNNLYCIEMSHSEEWLIFFILEKCGTGQTEKSGDEFYFMKHTERDTSVGVQKGRYQTERGSYHFDIILQLDGMECRCLRPCCRNDPPGRVENTVEL